MRTLLVLAAFALSASALPAFADTGKQLPPGAIEVRYGDLNLDTAEGRVALNTRVNQAIGAICRRQPVRGLERRAACHSQLRADAVRQASGEARRALTDQTLAVAAEPAPVATP
jgi:UrcA family protein